MQTHALVSRCLTQSVKGAYSPVLPAVFAAGLLSASVPAQEPGLEKVVVEGKYRLDERLDTATGLGLSGQEAQQPVSILTSQRLIDQILPIVVDAVLNTVGVNCTEVDNLRNTLQARDFDIANYKLDSVPPNATLALRYSV